MYDDNKYITSSSIRITKEIVKILMQKFKIEEINSLLNDDNLELLYTKEEFKTLKFSKTVKNWYDDMEINNKKYKLLVSFRYYEMKAFLENVNKFVDDKNFKLGIVVKAKNDGNILLG